MTRRVRRHVCVHDSPEPVVYQMMCLVLHFWKPTTTDVTITADSHHPFSQKMVAYNYFIRRLLRIPLNENDFKIDLNIIKHIAVANGYTCLLYTSRCV